MEKCVEKGVIEWVSQHERSGSEVHVQMTVQNRRCTERLALCAQTPMSLMDCEYLLIVCDIACCGILAVDDFVASPHVTSSYARVHSPFNVTQQTGDTTNAC